MAEFNTRELLAWFDKKHEKDRKKLEQLTEKLLIDVKLKGSLLEPSTKKRLILKIPAKPSKQQKCEDVIEDTFVLPNDIWEIIILEVAKLSTSVINNLLKRELDIVRRNETTFILRGIKSGLEFGYNGEEGMPLLFVSKYFRKTYCKILKDHYNINGRQRQKQRWAYNAIGVFAANGCLNLLNWMEPFTQHWNLGDVLVRAITNKKYDVLEWALQRGGAEHITNYSRKMLVTAAYTKSPEMITWVIDKVKTWSLIASPPYYHKHILIWCGAIDTGDDDYFKEITELYPIPFEDKTSVVSDEQNLFGRPRLELFMRAAHEHGVSMIKAVKQCVHLDIESIPLHEKTKIMEDVLGGTEYGDVITELFDYGFPLIPEILVFALKHDQRELLKLGLAVDWVNIPIDVFEIAIKKNVDFLRAISDKPRFFRAKEISRLMAVAGRWDLLIEFWDAVKLPLSPYCYDNALRQDKKDMIEWLIFAACPFHPPEQLLPLTTCGPDVSNIIYIAIKKNDIDTVKLALKSGATWPDGGFNTMLQYGHTKMYNKLSKLVRTSFESLHKLGGKHNIMAILDDSIRCTYLLTTGDFVVDEKTIQKNYHTITNEALFEDYIFEKKKDWIKLLLIKAAKHGNVKFLENFEETGRLKDFMTKKTYNNMLKGAIGFSHMECFTWLLKYCNDTSNAIAKMVISESYTITSVKKFRQLLTIVKDKLGPFEISNEWYFTFAGEDNLIGFIGLLTYDSFISYTSCFDIAVKNRSSKIARWLYRHDCKISSETSSSLVSWKDFVKMKYNGRSYPPLYYWLERLTKE